MAEVERCILNAKVNAIKISQECGMFLNFYGDGDLLFPGTEIINAAAENDYEDESIEETEQTEETNVFSVRDVISISEDISLIKDKSSSIPSYRPLTESSSEGRRYSLFNKAGKSPFIEYNGSFIRKTTALYLLQEKNQVSNDRLLRVRSSQPSHLFNDDNVEDSGPRSKVNSGDLCIFNRIDSNQKLVGRVIQFSYLEGNKKQRQYSSSYVDMSLESHKNIGVFANWYAISRVDYQSEKVFFQIFDAFTIGYLSMANYVSTINQVEMADSEDDAFSIPIATLVDLFDDWEETMSSITD